MNIRTVLNAVAPFEVLTYRREDGNVAIYKVARFTKRPMTKDGAVSGFRAWKRRNTGTSEEAGWRGFRHDRILKSERVFA